MHVFKDKGVCFFRFSMTELKCINPFNRFFPVIMWGLMFTPRSLVYQSSFPLFSVSLCLHPSSVSLSLFIHSRFFFCVCVTAFFSLTYTHIQGATRSGSFTASHQREGVTGTNVCSLDDTVRCSPGTLGTLWKCCKGTDLKTVVRECETLRECKCVDLTVQVHSCTW